MFSGMALAKTNFVHALSMLRCANLVFLFIRCGNHFDLVLLVVSWIACSACS